MCIRDRPEPDSPTIAVVWPARIAKLTSATASTRPSSVAKDVLRWRTSRRFIDRGSHRLAQARIEQVADTVAEQLQRERGDDDRQPGKQHDPQRLVRILLAARDHRAPGPVSYTHLTLPTSDL